MKPQLTNKQIQTIHNNAKIWGGSFEKAITEALRLADMENQIKLEKEFIELFNKILSWN